jgi:hypothetical protein
MALLPVLAKPRPAARPTAGRGSQLNFQIARYKVRVGTDQLVMARCVPGTLSCVVESKSSRAARKMSFLMFVMLLLLNLLAVC